MAKFGLPKGSGKRLKVREKSVKSQGILKWILSGNPGVSGKDHRIIMGKCCDHSGAFNFEWILFNP